MDTSDSSRSGDSITRQELLRRGAAVGLVLAGGRLATDVGSAAAAELAPKPVKGGSLRVALAGLSASADNLTPLFTPRSGLDQARSKNWFDRLYTQTPNGSFEPQLAAEAAANKAVTVWTIKLRNDVLWHDGSPFTADDVVYTFGQILNPTSVYGAARSNLPMLERVVKVDKRTVRFLLNRPWADFTQQLGHITMAMMKKGTTQFVVGTPGTGPFILKSWNPGQGYVLGRNPHYYLDPKPYLNEVVVTGVSDPTARLNGLQSGQFDAIERLDPTQAGVITANSAFQLLVGPPGSSLPFCMNTQAPPFNDVRVRQALKLLIDREQAVAVGLQGYGAVGNDVFCPGDPLYAGNRLPQRKYDPDQAKSLLSAAGQSNLSVTLNATDLFPQMLSAALLFAESAKAGGVSIDVVKGQAATYFTQVWGHVPFEGTFYGYRPFMPQWVTSLSNTGNNQLETHWNNRLANNAINAVASTTNPNIRKAQAFKAQQLLWSHGGYIVWGFQKQVDALSHRVHGIVPSRALPLGYYAFWDAWLM